MTKITYLSIFIFLLANTVLRAESTISSSTSEAKQATATVNFVIKIPYKMALIATNKKTLFNSNTGNLLITNQQTNSRVFISQNAPIKLRQSPQGRYTVASP